MSARNKKTNKQTCESDSACNWTRNDTCEDKPSKIAMYIGLGIFGVFALACIVALGVRKFGGPKSKAGSN